MKKKVVVALGHRALGTTLPEQKVAVKKTAVSIADLVEEGYQVVITHSNGPQVGMIHTAIRIIPLLRCQSALLCRRVTSDTTCRMRFAKN